MDNFHIDVTSEGRDMLLLALRLAFRNCPGGTASHFHQADKVLVLFWSTHKDAIPFLTPMDAAGVEPLVSQWLAKADYGSQPDHDGDNEKGWRVSCDDWGHVKPFGWPSFVRIEPAWAMYGK